MLKVILKEMSKTVERPDREDYSKSAAALYKLDDANSFSSSEIRSGEFGKFKSFRPFNSTFF